MDRSLQERLAGAAVLVALGVWLIPWVLDGSAVSEPEQFEQTSLRLPLPEPAQLAPIRRETIELVGNRNAGQKASAAPAERDAEPPAKQVVAPERAAEEKLATSARPLASDAVAERAAGVPAVPARDESNVATDILAASPVAGWMVQLGSFSDAGNARRQAQRISTYGHDARIYEFASAGGRTMFRVRLGPVDTRERAEQAASALAAQGFVAQLVAPE